MNDYNFGLNLVTLLNSLAILDDHEIDSNQIEVEVVEENGQEGFATVEIQSLAKDAADTITALQQKLDALAESMPSLNDEERQKYIDAISTNMRSISEERDENLQFEYDILRLARAALITHDTADKAG